MLITSNSIAKEKYEKWGLTSEANQEELLIDYLKDNSIDTEFISKLLANKTTEAHCNALLGKIHPLATDSIVGARVTQVLDKTPFLVHLRNKIKDSSPLYPKVLLNTLTVKEKENLHLISDFYANMLEASASNSRALYVCLREFSAKPISSYDVETANNTNNFFLFSAMQTMRLNITEFSIFKQITDAGFMIFPGTDNELTCFADCLIHWLGGTSIEPVLPLNRIEGFQELFTMFIILYQSNAKTLIQTAQIETTSRGPDCRLADFLVSCYAHPQLRPLMQEVIDVEWKPSPQEAAQLKKALLHELSGLFDEQWLIYQEIGNFLYRSPSAETIFLIKSD